MVSGSVGQQVHRTVVVAAVFDDPVVHQHVEMMTNGFVIEVQVLGQLVGIPWSLVYAPEPIGHDWLRREFR